MKFNKFLLLVACMIASSLGCQKKLEDEATQKYLYVASGLCYSGTGNTTYTAATASNIIYKVSLTTGTVDSIIADYTIASETTGNTPTAISNFDDDYILALVENSTTTSGRKVEKIAKKTNSNKPIYFNNLTALSAALRTMTRTSDGSLLISKSTAVEKVNTTPARMTIGASTPWINAPAGNCTTSATYISSLQTLSTGNIVYTHANASQNKIGIISKNGYTVAGDCVISAAKAAPATAAFPTASVYLGPYNQLLVLYAGNTTATDINSIYAYDVNETTNTLSGDTNAFQNSNVLYGGSAITFDSTTGHVYLATANSTSTTITNYNIEKFSYDPTSKQLTRVGSTPFMTGWTGSKCISSMFIAN